MNASSCDLHPDRPLKCLLIYPAFPENAYWNWKDVCHAMGRQAMGIPLGMLTFAATLPPQWELRLLDLNTAPWDDELWEWADLICVGGMIIQQSGIFEIFRLARRDGKFLIVGGADATSQPALYRDADALVLGEAENTVPIWLDAWRQGHPRGEFRATERPDVKLSPVPRYDLLNVDDYMSVNVQFSRGCPFNCEFCDIIELYGRQPRTKTPEQFCRELDALYDLGYRGWVDVVDDNFVGNKRNVRQLLPVLDAWSREHDYPFYYSTQASINLAEDPSLMQAMTAVDFRTVFIGIETPDPKLLATTQKSMNVFKPISDRIAKIYEHGLAVTAGFILGFDGESEGAGDVVIECIEKNSIPIAMASLLAALPNTQLSRRLAREGRLLDSGTCEPIPPGQRHELLLPQVKGEAPDQAALGGLKFTTTRNRYQILQEHRLVWQTIYEPRRYFARVLRAAKCIKARCKHKPDRVQQRQLDRGFLQLVRTMWRIPGVRGPLLWTLFRGFLLGPSRFQYIARMIVAYLQFHKIRSRIDEGLPDRVRFEQSKQVPEVWVPPERSPEDAGSPRPLETIPGAGAV